MDYSVLIGSDENYTYLYVKELTADAVSSKLTVYFTEYDENGKITNLEKISGELSSDGNRVFEIDCADTKNFKIMLWTDEFKPIINSIKSWE